MSKFLQNVLKLVAETPVLAPAFSEPEETWDDDIALEDEAYSAESSMRDMLDVMPTSDIIGFLNSQIQFLSPEDRASYSKKVRIWGPTNNRGALIDMLMDIIDTEAVMQMLPQDVSASRKRADDRYWPKSPTSGPTSWKPELEESQPGLRNILTTPAGPPEVKPESERMHSHPEEEYKDPELFEKSWAVGEPLLVPDEIPDFSTLGSDELRSVERDLKKQIGEAFGPSGQIGLPRPYVMDMVYQYLKATNQADAEKYNIDGVDSRSRFGFNTGHLISRLTKHMPIDDLYMYWNSIVNHKILPFVNTEWVEQRYGGGAMGENIGERYSTWKEETDLSGINAEWPADTAWSTEVAQPAWFENVTGPTGAPWQQSQ